MIQVLIVDDEIHCAEGAKCAVDWNALGVEQVFTAYNMKQAQKVLQEQIIHIILCDVEMPKGSGIDLLKWIKENNLSIISILLTSYATFQYAKQAIELGVMDYLLKPIAQEELVAVFKKAVQAVNDKREKDKNMQLADFWNEEERRRVSRFWREVLEKEIAPDSAAIMEQAKQEHLTFNENNRYLAILFKVYALDLKENQEMLIESVRKILQEEIFCDWDQVVLAYHDNCLLSIIGYVENLQEHYANMMEGCHILVNTCRVKLQVPVTCYMGEFRESGQLAFQYEELLQMDRDNVTECAGVYNSHTQRQTIGYNRPDMEAWMDLFAEGKYGEVYKEIDRYIDNLAHVRKVNSEVLNYLFHDIMQAFYIAVDRKGVQMYLLFQDEDSIKLYQSATKSIRDFKKWVMHLVQKAAIFVEMAANTDSVVSRIKKYIDNNICEELTRTQLANYVYLSPDYLSRIFKQEIGIQLTEYITQKRIQRAKRLLKETDLSIGEIAFSVGYSNWAYFSKVFREKNGETPAQFRAH
jgi:Response regulator containing CheY-like receiver domain and AraC-type DNA-binding domain